MNTATQTAITALSPVVKDAIENVVARRGAVVSNEAAAQVTKEVAAVVVNQTNQEPWYQSRVVLGTIVSLLAIGGGFLGVQVDALAQGEIVDNAIKIIGAAGALFALYGRLRAGLKPLGK